MTYKTKGIIIKRINIGEADKIITFYTATMGKIRARAQAVRRSESKLAGHLELFMLSDLIFAKGQNLDVVTSAQIINSFSSIRYDLYKTSFAYFIVELIEKLIPEELKDSRIFNLLTNTFQILDDKKLAMDQLPILLLFFELKLLDLLGFAPQLLRCVHCAKEYSSSEGAQRPNQKVLFSSLLGGILCENCKSFDRLAPSISNEEIKLVNRLRSHNIDYGKFNNLKINFDIIRALSQKIDYFIRFIFGKNIKSSQLISQVARLGD
ncbi:MAG: DNA repair protein RecO [Patescibacteria group bacterium]